ncbi:MAG TPA: class I SAM-dependent methyltransferase [Xanthobacteraceae bacterium]|nr:class I SAM-dependent methyltransferase [Xanthobacteraceae bacterium]
MDQQTLTAYDRDAAAFAAEWDAQPPAADLQAAVKRYFAPGPTADIGCGSGRDTAWLTENGFPAVGYDPSAGLLAQARRLHPGIEFRRAGLPELDGIADASFVNVLCETVIMHLDPADIPSAVDRLLAILRPGGTLYLTWRVSEDGNRDKRGRLYTAFDPSLVRGALAPAQLLLDEEAFSASSGKLVRRIVARKGSKA